MQSILKCQKLECDFFFFVNKKNNVILLKYITESYSPCGFLKYLSTISLWLMGHLKIISQKQVPLSEKPHMENWKYLCSHIVVNFIFTINWNSRCWLTCNLIKLGEHICDLWGTFDILQYLIKKIAYSNKTLYNG